MCIELTAPIQVQLFEEQNRKSCCFFSFSSRAWWPNFSPSHRECCARIAHPSISIKLHTSDITTSQVTRRTSHDSSGGCETMDVCAGARLRKLPRTQHWWRVTYHVCCVFFTLFARWALGTMVARDVGCLWGRNIGGCVGVHDKYGWSFAGSSPPSMQLLIMMILTRFVCRAALGRGRFGWSRIAFLPTVSCTMIVRRAQQDLIPLQRSLDWI